MLYVCTQRVVYGFNTDTALASSSIIMLLNKKLRIGQVTGPKSAVQAQAGSRRKAEANTVIRGPITEPT